MKEKRRIFLKEQIKLFKDKFDDLRLLTDKLEQILERMAGVSTSDFIIQSRVKTLSSFVEKIVRQPHYKNPVSEITDLCGIRVILPTLNEVNEVCNLIENNFLIDEKLGGDKLEKLKSSEFGYLSTHYSVRLKPESKFLEDLVIPEHFFDLKAEIQVRTIIQHAWAAIYHDAGFKGKFDIHKKWDRGFSRLAAILEEADESFSRIKKTLKRYESSYGEFMDEHQIKETLEILEMIYSAEPDNLVLAQKIAKMAICIGDWEKAINILSNFAESKKAPLIRDLGIAMTKFHPKDSIDYEKGRLLLEKAIELDPLDFDAFASLGGCWKDSDEQKARYYYKKAFEINPSDPYCLGNYLIYEIRNTKNLGPISLSKPTIQNAVEKFNDQIELEINLPWAYFDKGLFNLFLNKFDESINSYLLGLKYSTDDWMVDTTLKTLNLLDDIIDQIPEIILIKKLLLLGLNYRFKTEKAEKELRDLYKLELENITSPVIIIAGSTSQNKEKEIQEYNEILIKGFDDFNGSIISGGTTSGISGIVGAIQEKYPISIKTHGYIPKSIPNSVEIDSRYKEIHKTTGLNFSIREVIQYWLDIWASSMDIRQVKLLGIGGGKISGFEYRLALIFGIKVGFLEEKEGSVSILLQDPKWHGYKIGKNAQIKILKNDAGSIKNFLPK